MGIPNAGGAGALTDVTRRRNVDTAVVSSEHHRPSNAYEMSPMPTAESSGSTEGGLPTGLWNVDTARSSVAFHVKHLRIATVKGRFDEFEGTLEVTPEGTAARGSVAVESLDTRDSQRDAHLRSAGFFDAEEFPRITFLSTAITQIDGDSFEIEGDFAVHGITRPLKLHATLHATETGHGDRPRVRLSASAQMNRSEHELRFDRALGAGNVAVGEKVEILLEISAIKED